MKQRRYHFKPWFRVNRTLLTMAAASLAALTSSGAATDATDVTAKVATAVKDASLSIIVSNDLFGDTASGVFKKLRVEYRLGDLKGVKEVDENGKLEISAPPGQQLVIVKASYGPADGSVPVPAVAVDFAENPQEALQVLEGFQVEHVLRANLAKNGSWICLQKDPQGRLLLGGQGNQPITRVTLEQGKCVKEEVLHIPVSEAMGMLFVDQALYINGKGSKGFGLYRCKDTKGDDSYDDVEMLREWVGGSGEHGAHGLVLGADRMLYAVCGNFTDAPKDLAPSSPHRNYADDLALKRMEDGNGFGVGKPPPGGYVLRMDLDGKNAELFSAGQRNDYDIACNADGELFGFDSDMEWDWGNPWYRPVRVFHAVRGGDHGFREGSAKWPEYYPDSLPASVTIGIGCPTGVVFGTGAHFPAKYQKAFYICDWTYGRIMAVHLTPDGASYRGSWENLVAPKSLLSKAGKAPLNLTDVVIGGDGAMYFTVGGHSTQSDLFRVTYAGGEPAKALPESDLRDQAGREARALRHRLEALNVQEDAKAVEAAWGQLRHPDRFIRYAARLVLERNPVATWQGRALAEPQADAAFTALLALARVGAVSTQADIVKALAAFPFAQLSEEQVLHKLRVIEVSLARQGLPGEAVAAQLIAQCDPLYPARTEFANRELCQILLALHAPQAVARTVGLLRSASTQEEQTSYATALRSIKSGWTEELRREYLSWWNGGSSSQHPAHVMQWFADVGIDYHNGSSFKGFRSQALKEAKASMSPAELAAMGDLTQIKPAAAAVAAPVRQLVKEWSTADLQPSLGKVSGGRDFARGQAAFAAAQCALCHRYGDQGGAVGPDLTNVASRIKRQDLLESTTEPSKVLSEQYLSTVFTLQDGTVVAGRISQETPDQVAVLTNPFDATATTAVAKANIKSREASKVSLMPAGLLNTFKEEEILDLLAYLESMGNPKHPNFEK